MDLSLLDSVVAIQDVPAGKAKVKMSELQVRKLKLELREGNRANVYPNQFDVQVPFHVSIKKGKEFIEFGDFTDVDAATAVGTIAGLTVYGIKARRGSYDKAKAQVHPEYVAWCADPANQHHIELAQVVLMEMNQLSA